VTAIRWRQFNALLDNVSGGDIKGFVFQQNSEVYQIH
jgi:hypothetical protein